MPAGGLVQKSFSIFFFFILKHKLAAFGLWHLRECGKKNQKKPFAAEVNHKRGVEGIEASASAVFQTCHLVPFYSSRNQMDSLIVQFFSYENARKRRAAGLVWNFLGGIAFKWSAAFESKSWVETRVHPDHKQFYFHCLGVESFPHASPVDTKIDTVAEAWKPFGGTRLHIGENAGFKNYTHGNFPPHSLAFPSAPL